MTALQGKASPCSFVVFFERANWSVTPEFPRSEIAEFIRQSGFFAKGPSYKPSARSEQFNAPNWFTLEINDASAGCKLEVVWLDCNHARPQSIEPIKAMARALIVDAGVNAPDALTQQVTNSKDAICLFAPSGFLPAESSLFEHGLKQFLLKRLMGILFEPCRGFFDASLQPLLEFPAEANIARAGEPLIARTQCNGMALSPDGRTIGIAGETGNKATLWRAESGELIHTHAGHKKPCKSITFSPDGAAVATGGADKLVITWSTATGQIDKLLQGHTGVVGSVAFSPDGRLFASGGYDGTVILWEFPSGKIRNTISEHGPKVLGLVEGERWESSKAQPASVCSVAFSPDGKLLASGGADGTVRIVTVDSGKLVSKLEGYKESAWPVVFSPDGRRIAAGSYDKKVRMWDLKSGKLEGTFGPHGDYVFALAFSPDGSKLATGSSDTLIRIWSVDLQARLVTYVGHREAVNTLSYFPDGKRILSASNDGTVRQWPAH